MEYLSSADILLVHSAIIDETGGSHGMRDRHAIATLEDLPRQEAFGKELYPDVYTKAAVYLRNIIGGHQFVDGNKRTAVTVADVFLQLNGSMITAPKGKVERFAVSVATERLDLTSIAAWIKANTSRSKP